MGLGGRTSPEMLDFMHAHYSHETMLRAYEDVIVNARRLDDLTYRYTPIDESTRFGLAPWCYLSPRGVYHDFLATYNADPLLCALVGDGGFTFGQASARGADRVAIMDWYRDGYLTPSADP